MDPVTPTIPPEPTPVVPPQPQPLMASTVEKKSPALAIILGLLLIAALTAAGYFAYQNYQLTSKPPQPPSPITIIPRVQTPIPSADLTADWKIFTYEPIGHVFKYPSNWALVQCEGGIHLFTQPTQRAGTSCEVPPFGVIFIAFDQKPIETGYLKSKDYILEREQNITTLFGKATKRVIKRVNETDGPSNYFEITYQGTNKYYYLISTENPQYEIFIDQILSTFKFTK